MITSTSNPHVKLLRSLHESRGRRAESAFLVEGVRLVEEALATGAPARAFYVHPESLAATPRGAALLSRLRLLDRPVHELSESGLAAASGTVTPQGVLAILPIPPRPRLPDAARLILVVDALQDPGNLGTILRSAAASGTGAVITTAGTADIYAPKTVRAAMGAHFRLPILAGLTWPEVQPLLIGRQTLLAAPAGGTRYDRVDWTRPTALIIGGEPHGAGLAARDAATSAVSIPMAAGVESLNAAVAAAVLLFEARRQWLAAGIAG